MARPPFGGKPPAAGPSDLGMPSGMGGAPPPSPVSKANDAQETPDDEAGEASGVVAPTPESVNYRTADETCMNCEYMQGDQCSFLQQPVSGGDSCNRFEGKSQDDDAMGGGAPAMGGGAPAMGGGAPAMGGAPAAKGGGF